MSIFIYDSFKFIQALVLGEDLQGHAFVRLKTDNQLVVGKVLLVRIKNVMRRRLEVDDDLGQLFGEAFTSANVKRDT